MAAQLKALEQKETDTPKRSRWQKIIKIRAEIDQIETKRTMERINKTKIWFFEKNNKIDKPLARLTRGQRESIQIDKIRKKSGAITTKSEEIQEIIRSYYKSLYSSNLENLEEKNKFLDSYKILKLNQEQVNPLHYPITPKEIEAVIKSLPTKKKPRSRWVQCRILSDIY